MQFLKPLLLLFPTLALAALPISNGAQSAAVISSSGSMRIYYQADDTSIREVSASTSANTYSEATLLPIGIARPNTPIAVVGTPDLAQITFFYIGTAYAPSPNPQLRGYAWANGVGWQDSTINDRGYGIQPGTEALYAVGSPAPSSVYRVGFNCGGGGLCEANSTTGWPIRHFAN